MTSQPPPCAALPLRSRSPLSFQFVSRHPVSPTIKISGKHQPLAYLAWVKRYRLPQTPVAAAKEGMGRVASPHQTTAKPMRTPATTACRMQTGPSMRTPIKEMRKATQSNLRRGLPRMRRNREIQTRARKTPTRMDLALKKSPLRRSVPPCRPRRTSIATRRVIGPRP